MPICQHKNIVNNSKDNVSILESSNPNTVDPDNCNIAETQDSVSKLAFIETIKVFKEEMNNSFKEINAYK